jgi:hypothetical protein
MRYDNHPWDWIITSDPFSALLFALPFLIGSALGAVLASLVTWVEDHLGAQNV